MKKSEEVKEKVEPAKSDTTSTPEVPATGESVTTPENVPATADATATPAEVPTPGDTVPPIEAPTEAPTIPDTKVPTEPAYALGELTFNEMRSAFAMFINVLYGKYATIEDGPGYFTVRVKGQIKHLMTYNECELSASADFPCFMKKEGAQTVAKDEGQYEQLLALGWVRQ